MTRPTRRLGVSVVAGVCALAIAGCAAHTRASNARQPPPNPPRPPASVSLEDTDSRLTQAQLALKAGVSTNAHLHLADEYLRRGVLDAAFDQFTAAIALDPGEAKAREGLAQIWRDWGFTDFALAEARQAVSLAPASASAHNTLGTVLLRSGDLGAAIDEFQQASVLAPSAAYVMSNLCYASVRAGELASAKASCAQALLLDPTLEAAHSNLGEAFALSGDFPRAHQEFLLAENASDAAYHLGLAYLRAGRLDDAERAFQAAVNGNSTASKARDRLREITTMRRRNTP